MVPSKLSGLIPKNFYIKQQIKFNWYKPEELPSFLALLLCDVVGASAFLFTAMVVAVVVAAVTDAVVVVVEAAFAAVMGFMVAETVFTGRISTFSGVLSVDLKI